MLNNEEIIIDLTSRSNMCEILKINRLSERQFPSFHRIVFRTTQNQFAIQLSRQKIPYFQPFRSLRPQRFAMLTDQLIVAVSTLCKITFCRTYYLPRLFRHSFTLVWNLIAASTIIIQYAVILLFGYECAGISYLWYLWYQLVTW